MYLCLSPVDPAHPVARWARLPGGGVARGNRIAPTAVLLVVDRGVAGALENGGSLLRVEVGPLSDNADSSSIVTTDSRKIAISSSSLYSIERPPRFYGVHGSPRGLWSLAVVRRCERHR